MAQKLYRLLKRRGDHVKYEGKKPITYKGGDAVPSEHNLAEMFPNRFVLIGPEENEGVEVEQPDIPVPTSVKTSKKTSKPKSKKTTPKKTTSTQRKRAVPRAKSEGA